MRDVYPVNTVDEYRSAIAELWGLPHHEERYLALAVASSYREFVRFRQLDVYRRLIVEGAWWDYVDEVAIRCVGGVLLVDRGEMSPVVDAWASDDDLWIRRSALLAHIKHKERTDVDQLFRHCLQLAPETEFFIRKAIGWALREYAKTDPDAVRTFVLDHEDALSRLSFVEASKHLDL